MTASEPKHESSTARFVKVLETFTPDRVTQTASEIGRRAGLPSSSAHRIVAELVAAGLLDRDADRQIRVGLRLWELTTRSSQPLWLRQVALPYMEQVQAGVGEHTQLVVLEQDEALCIERLSSPDAGENLTVIAGRLPLHASSSGLVLLANAERAVQERVLSRPLRRIGPGTVTDPGQLRRLLAQVRADGFVVAVGAMSPASTGVAVPVHDRTGEVIAALSVVLPQSADPGPSLAQLRRASEAINQALMFPDQRENRPQARRHPDNPAAVFEANEESQ